MMVIGRIALFQPQACGASMKRDDDKMFIRISYRPSHQQLSSPTPFFVVVVPDNSTTSISQARANFGW